MLHLILKARDVLLRIVIAAGGVDPRGLVGFADNCKVTDSRVPMPDVPGVGFEAKNDLYKVMKGMLN